MHDLTYSAQTLTSLSSEMATLASAMVDDLYVPDLAVTLLARDEVVQALQELENDWVGQRRALASRLDAAGRLASAAVTTFSEADRELAEAALNGGAR